MGPSNKTAISIIIPVYNEEASIREILEKLCKERSAEIIVVDGGSTDKTLEIVEKFPVKIYQTNKNRALQMNTGAKYASCGIFLFLHADSKLTINSLAIVKDAINKGYAGGCFSQYLDSFRFIYRVIETTGNIRAKMFKIFYGDQAIFVRRDIFWEISGFDNVPLFEDVLFSKKMKKAGETCVLKNKVFVSIRRWQNQGVIKTTLIFWLLTIGFYLGVPLDKLKKVYLDIR